MSLEPHRSEMAKLGCPKSGVLRAATGSAGMAGAREFARSLLRKLGSSKLAVLKLIAGRLDPPKIIENLKDLLFI